MDPHGGIHTMVRAMEDGGPQPRGDGQTAHVDAETIRKKFGPLVPIPAEMLEELRQRPRAQRRAWYAEYRRRLKVAKKRGKEAVPPPVPSLPRR
jgi:hypothetical protein